MSLQALKLDYDKNKTEGFLPVVLVDNGMFTAAGVAFSKRDLEEFISPTDLRQKKYYLVPTDKLHEVSPDLKSYLEK